MPYLRAQGVEVEPGHGGERDDGRAQRPEGDRRRIRDEREARRLERSESQGDEDSPGDGHRGAESGRPFDERTEGEGDQQELEPLVGGDPGDSLTERVEQATPLHQAVEEDHVQYDPADGEESEGGAQCRAPERHSSGHSDDQHRDQQGGGQTCQRRQVSPEADRKSTRLNSSHGYISYAVFCLKKKKKKKQLES